MIINNNFISIVFLGNFNPAILTKEFLEKNEIIIFDKEPNISFTPVISVIETNNIKIIVDIGRFQVLERNIDDFSKNVAVAIAYKYLNILEHTPLRVVGVNFNANARIKDIESLIDFNNHKKLMEFFKTEFSTISVEKKFEKGKEEFNSFNMLLKLSDEILTNIRIENTKNDIYRVNYNFEVRNLNKKNENKLFIKENFSEILNKFCKTNKKFFGE